MTNTNSLNLEAWGILSAGAHRRGLQAFEPQSFWRQAFYLGAGSPPLPSGRFLIIWDDDGSDVFWAGMDNGYDGQGWTDERRMAREFVTREHADIELRAARATVRPGRWELVLVHEAA